MNWEASKLREAREAELKRLGGPEAYARHALRNLRLKTVIKVRLREQQKERIAK